MSLRVTPGPQCGRNIFTGWCGWKEVEDGTTRGEFTDFKIVPAP
ncbi:MAG: hypothetical protein WCA79_12850 [Anaerolineales bacterium]